MASAPVVIHVPAKRKSSEETCGAALEHPPGIRLSTPHSPLSHSIFSDSTGTVHKDSEHRSSPYSAAILSTKYSETHFNRCKNNKAIEEIKVLQMSRLFLPRH